MHVFNSDSSFPVVRARSIELRSNSNMGVPGGIDDNLASTFFLGRGFVVKCGVRACSRQLAGVFECFAETLFSSLFFFGLIFCTISFVIV